MVCESKRDGSPKNENYVINYSPSSHSKPIRLLFIFRTHIKIFIMNSERFLSLCLKGSYDAFLKVIILCIWCNRICWHDLMFKFFFFSNTVHYCRSSMPRLSQTLRFYTPTKSLLQTSTVCSDWPTDPEHCDWLNTTCTSWKCNAPYHNRELHLSK